MKNQYFGDIRDLFKYDLLHSLMQSIPCLHQCTIIPMLTPDEPSSSDGRRRDFHRAVLDHRPGSGNSVLVRALENITHDLPGTAGVEAICNFFDRSGIRFSLYNPGYYLSYKDREAYFSGIPQGLLKNSCTFLDPDIGLEIMNSNEKHLLYREAAYVFARLGPHSLLIIYQHFPRMKREPYVCRRLSELSGVLDVPCLAVTDNEIVFFIAPTDEETLEWTAASLERYVARYPRCRIISQQSFISW